MSGIDVPSLRAFVAVCELRSVTEAGRQMGMTQAAISQRLKRLEDHVRLPLIDREHRPIDLTAAGQVLFKRALNILGEIDRLDYDLQIRSNLPLPELRIGIADSFGSTLVPPLVQAVKDSFLQLAVRVDCSSTLCRLLLERELQAVVSSDALTERDDLERHELLREPLIIVLPKNEDASGASLSLERLVHEGVFIRYSPISPLAQQIETSLTRLGLRPERKMEFNASEAIMEAVRHGLGWTITTPLCLVQTQIRLCEFAIQRFPVDGADRSILLLSRRHELGGLPRRLAHLSRQVIFERVLKRLDRELPWLAPQMNGGKRTDAPI